LELPADVMEKVLGLIQTSIQAVHSSVAAGLPWHHVANIPFQAICTLLVIDTEQSFALLSDCLACVVAVNDEYQTEATREATTAACTLLRLHRKRREANIREQSNMLSLYPSGELLLAESFNVDLDANTLQDFWWLNEFVAQPDMIEGSGIFM
jgi:hypothetical protein